MQRGLGLKITPKLLRTVTEDLISQKFANHIVIGLPDIIDLRSIMPPVQDQGQCGSCVAFGMNATIEGTNQVINKQYVKLSEWDIFQYIGTCEEGASLEDANEAAKTKGVCPEVCWPYNGTKQACANDIKQKTYITSDTRITSDAEAKAWLANGNGPINAAMDVYYDFYAINSDKVYTTNGTNIQGGHDVCIVGYDETNKCWIVRNSWGVSWGAKGYFRIAYGTCNILRGYAAYGIKVPSVTPTPTPTPTPETGDIVLPVTGNLSMKIGIKSTTTNSLTVNGVNKGKISAIDKIDLGTIEAGKGFTFGLITSTGRKYHYIKVRSIGNSGKIWELLMGTSNTMSISFIIELV